MPTQRCPNCEFVLDTSVFVSGQKVPCPSCALTLEVARVDVSVLRSARPTTSGTRNLAVNLAPAVEPVRPPSRPTEVFGGAGDHTTQAPGSSIPPPVPGSSPGGLRPTVVRTAMKIPGYELSQVLGRGGMGEVWQARQLSLGREVAIKILAPDLAQQVDFIKRFEKEAAALAALSHAGIVQIIDRGQASGVPFIVMEYVHGRSLRDLMEQKKLTASDALKIVVQVASAIDYAHAHGVIHRDLKPENILVGSEGGVKVADFGLAGIQDAKFNVTHTSMTMGTLNYMAPEQRKDAKNVDGRADIFSLGVMLYELLTGAVPVGRFKLPSELLPGLDTRVDAVVIRALESEPADRFQKASELISPLEGLLSTVSLPASALPDAQRPLPYPASQAGEVSRPPPPATRPDAPGNLDTQNPTTLAPRVATHVHRTGKIFGRALVGMVAIIGALTVVQLLTGKNLISVDDSGLTLLGHISIAGRASGTDGGGVEALPRDTEGDVDVALEAVSSASGDTVLDSDLRPGTSASLIALDGTWTPTDAGLVAREFGRLEGESERPRATLEEPSFRLRDVIAQVQVQIDPAPPAGYAPKVPRAVLFFHGEEILLELSMELGEVPVYRVVNKYNDASGKLVSDTAGDAEFNQVAPPPAKSRVTLRVVSKGGSVMVLADNKPILKRALKLPESVMNQAGRIGVACEEATCRFSGLHVEGPAERDRALLKDDQHKHTVVAPEEARAP